MIRADQRKGNRSKQSPRRNRRVALEPLETRVLYAVTTAISDGQLFVTGDGAADTITVSHAAPSTTVVNGLFFADPLFPNGIVVNAGGGDDTIVLQSAVAPVTLDGQGGTDRITLGAAGSARDITNAVFVQDNGSDADGETTLTIDDTAVTASMDVRVAVNPATGVGTVSGMTLGVVTYADARVSPVLRSGTGSDSFGFDGSDAVGGLTADSGAGVDKFDVRSSFGTLRLNGGPEGTSFRLSSGSSSSGGGGSQSGFTGEIGDVFIDSDGGSAVVTLDDSRQTAPRSVTLSTDAQSYGSITGLTRASTSVHFDPSEVTTLIVNGGSGGNTFTVADLTNNGTQLNTGTGNDMVNVMKTAKPLSVKLQSGAAGGTEAVTVGGGPNGAQDVRGLVSVSSLIGARYDLTVDDSADPAPRTAALTRLDAVAEVTGLAPATIKYSAGVKNLNILGGTGANTLSVDETTTPGTTNPFADVRTFIHAGAGNDTVNVQRTLEFVNVDGAGGTDTFNLGVGNSTREIFGRVFVNNQGGTYSANLNDSADTAARTVSVDYEETIGGVRGLMPGLVEYHVLALDTLTVNAGSGGNTITYDDSNPFGRQPRASVVINSGTGSDTVNVLRTFNPVAVRGNNSADVVNVGTGGSVQGIKAALLVSNVSSRSALNIDDSADPTGRVVTMGIANGTATLGGLAPAPIRYFVVDVSAVSVKAGPGGNVFTVEDTAQSIAKPVTTLNTGTGADTVNVRGTTGALAVNGQNGRDVVNVGADGSLQAIKGAVTITNAGSFSTITVNNEADVVGRAVSLAADNTSGQASITGLAPAAIAYRTFDLATLTVNGGSGADTFDVLGTAQNVSGPAATVLNTSGGADTINVRATVGALAVNAGSGNDVVNVGTVFNTLDAIQGPVRVSGQGDFDVLNVNDQGSLTPHVYGVTPTAVTRSGAATISYFGIESLRLNKGATNAGGTPPLAQNLALPAATQRGRQVTLTGRLSDPDSADTLTMAVDWGDGTGPTVLSPGRNPFAVNHRYRNLGEYTVRVIATDSTGQSNVQELHVNVRTVLEQFAAARRSAFAS